MTTPTSISRPRRGPTRLRSLSVVPVAVVMAFATAPLATFVYDNRYDLTDVTAVLPWWIATVALGLALLAALMMATREASADRLALLVGVLVGSFYNFGRLWVPADAGALELVEFALLALAVATGVFVVGRYATARRFVGLLGVTLAVVPILSYLGWRVSTPTTASTAAVPRPVASSPSGTGPTTVTASDEVPVPIDDVMASPVGMTGDAAAGEQPNVYIFLLDERSRRDQLASGLGVDTAAFEDELASLGFSVSPTSFAAYPKTMLSVSSVFDMDYVATSPEHVSAGLLTFRTKAQGDAAFVRGLRDRGYSFAYAHPGPFDWLPCEPALVDVCIDPRTSSLRMSEVDRVLAEMTPIGMLTRQTAPYTDAPYVLDQVEAHADRLPGPTLVFGHVLSPHGPYRYEADCSLREQFRESASLEAEARRAAYVQDLGCTDELTLQAMRRLVREDPSAIVVLFSDHGSNFGQEGATLADWSVDGLRERFGVLDAVRVPGCDSLPAERGVLVNTLRYVQACLDGTAPDLVEPRAFVWWEDNPLGLEEIPAPAQLFAP